MDIEDGIETRHGYKCANRFSGAYGHTININTDVLYLLLQYVYGRRRSAWEAVANDGQRK